MKTRPLILAAAALLATSVGACSRSQPDEAPVENADADLGDMPASMPFNGADETAPAPSGPIEANATAEVAPPADVSTNATDGAVDAPPVAPVDQQVMDDASATGMTSRSSRGEHGTDDPAPGQTEAK